MSQWQTLPLFMLGSFVLQPLTTLPQWTSWILISFPVLGSAESPFNQRFGKENSPPHPQAVFFKKNAVSWGNASRAHLTSAITGMPVPFPTFFFCSENHKACCQILPCIRSRSSEAGGFQHTSDVFHAWALRWRFDCAKCIPCSGCAMRCGSQAEPPPLEGIWRSWRPSLQDPLCQAIVYGTWSCPKTSTFCLLLLLGAPQVSGRQQTRYGLCLCPTWSAKKAEVLLWLLLPDRPT